MKTKSFFVVLSLLGLLPFTLQADSPVDGEAAAAAIDESGDPAAANDGGAAPSNEFDPRLGFINRVAGFTRWAR